MSNVLGGFFKPSVEKECDSFWQNYRKYMTINTSPDEREKGRQEALKAIQVIKQYKAKGGADWLANVPELKKKAEEVLTKEIRLMKPALVAREEQKPANPFAVPTPKPAEKPTEVKPPQKKAPKKKEKKEPEKALEKKQEAKKIEAPVEDKAARVKRLEAQIKELKHLDSRYYISPVSYMRAKFKPDDGQLKDLAHAGVYLKKGEKYSRNEIREAIGKELNKFKPAAPKHVVTDARELAGYAKYEFLQKKAQEEAKNAPPKKERVITDARQLAGYEKYEYLQKQAQEKKAAELKTQKPVKTEKKPEEKIYSGYARYEHLLDEARRKKAKEESAK